MDIIGTQAPMRILELLCKSPEAELYSRQIGVKLELSKATTIKWLKRLTKEGLLVETARGRRKFYRLRWGHPIARQIRVLFTLSELAPALRRLKDLRGAYLVGEAAMGSDAPDSPIELLILTRADPEYIRKSLERVSRRVGRPIEPHVMDQLAYAELSKKDRKLYERLEREKIRLVGAGGERR